MKLSSKLINHGNILRARNSALHDLNLAKNQLKDIDSIFTNTGIPKNNTASWQKTLASAQEAENRIIQSVTNNSDLFTDNAIKRSTQAVEALRSLRSANTSSTKLAAVSDAQKALAHLRLRSSSNTILSSAAQPTRSELDFFKTFANQKFSKIADMSENVLEYRTQDIPKRSFMSSVVDAIRSFFALSKDAPGAAAAMAEKGYVTRITM